AALAAPQPETEEPADEDDGGNQPQDVGGETQPAEQQRNEQYQQNQTHDFPSSNNWPSKQIYPDVTRRNRGKFARSASRGSQVFSNGPRVHHTTGRTTLTKEDDHGTKRKLVRRPRRVAPRGSRQD